MGACLDRFNGMWAFAIWDRGEHVLFLSRDPFGKKPLFHVPTRDGLAFASEMKALPPLIPAPSINYSLLADPERVHTYEATDECLFNSISRFPAGHYALVRPGEDVRPVRWWRTLDHLTEVPDRFEEQVERFRELFLDACRIRMRSDVPLGTSLSGGMDSSAVACAMAHLGRGGAGRRQAADWQNSFTASFPGTPVDEARYAAEVNRYTGIAGNMVEIDPLEAISSPDADHPAWQGMSCLNRSLYHTFTRVFPTLLRNYDRYSMANGVEIRMPLIDRRIVSFAFSLSWKAKLKGGYTKAVLRHACKDFMPRDIAFRKAKLGFNAPMVNWMTGPWKPYLTDLVHSRDFRQSEAVDAEKARNLLDALLGHASPPFSLAQQTWLAITPFLWERAMKHCALRAG